MREFKCPNCKKLLYSYEKLIEIRMNYFRSYHTAGEYTEVELVGQYARGVKAMPKEFEYICLNEKCIRFERPIDGLLLTVYESIREIKENTVKLGFTRSSNGRFKSDRKKIEI